MNTISFMSANFVARQLQYNMPLSEWAKGDQATQDYFRPLDTFAERFAALLGEVTAMGFTAIDIWLAHLHPAWATPEHIAVAKEQLAKQGVQVVSLAGGFGNTPEEVERARRQAHQELTFKITSSLPVEHPSTRRTTNQGN